MSQEVRSQWMVVGSNRFFKMILRGLAALFAEKLCFSVTVAIGLAAMPPLCVGQQNDGTAAKFLKRPL